jgi:hypothetical protein
MPSPPCLRPRADHELAVFPQDGLLGKVQEHHALGLYPLDIRIRGHGFRVGAAQVPLPKALSTDVIVPTFTGNVEA